MAGESRILSEIRLALGRIRGLVLFRQNTGQGWVGEVVRRTDDTITLKNYRPLHAGLCTGSSDLIGWRSVVVTPDMVGQQMAVFTAIEVKNGTGRLKKEQRTFLDTIKKAGGIAGVARSDAEAREIVNAPGVMPPIL